MNLLLLAISLCPPAAAQSTPVAGSVVRSQQWVIRRGANKEEEFIGNVRYDSAGTRLTSDWALFRHVDKTWQAHGAVAIRRETSDGTVFSSQGENAGYAQDSRKGFIEPARDRRVTFVRTPPGLEPDHGESGRVAWDNENRIVLSDGARVWGPRIELAADEAVYEKSGGRLTLNGGRPVLRKVEGEWTTALKADKIVALETPRRINATGRVIGWMIFKDPKKLKELAK